MSNNTNAKAIATLTGDALLTTNAATYMASGKSAAEIIGAVMDNKKAAIAVALAAPTIGANKISGNASCEAAGIAGTTGQRRIALGTVLLYVPASKRTNAFATALEDSKVFDKVRDGREGLTVTEAKAALRKFDGKSTDILLGGLIHAAEAKQAKAVAAKAEQAKAAERQKAADAANAEAIEAAKAEAAKAKAATPREAMAAKLAEATEALLWIMQQGNAADVLALMPEGMDTADVIVNQAKALADVTTRARRIATKAAKAAEAAEAKGAKATADAKAKAEADAKALADKVAATEAADAAALLAS